MTHIWEFFLINLLLIIQTCTDKIYGIPIFNFYSLILPNCLFTLFKLLKIYYSWLWILSLTILTLGIFLTLFPEIKLPPTIYYLVDEILIPTLFNIFIQLSEYYSLLLLWLVNITPPFPDIFGWVDLLFSLKFQKDFTYFICYTIPNLFELFEYLFKFHDFMCSFVEALLLIYISIKVLLNWLLCTLWPLLLGVCYTYKKTMFNKNPINPFIKNEVTLFFEWLILYYYYYYQLPKTTYLSYQLKSYTFSPKNWFSLWLGWSFRLKLTDSQITDHVCSPVLLFFDNNYLLSLKFLIFISKKRQLDWFHVEKINNNDVKLLSINTSDNFKNQFLLHPRDLKLLEKDKFLYFTLKEMLFCYLLKFKFWKLPTTPLHLFYTTLL
jgi:hypothetical protein